MDTCVVCYSKRSELLPFWTGLRRCAHCGHCMADMDAGLLNLKEIYSEKYFIGDEYADYLGDWKVHNKEFKSRLRIIKRFQPRGLLIEVGCAFGFFLAVAQKDYRVLGFDIAEVPTAYAREQLAVDARCEDFLEASIDPESVDVLVMWDTIEHLPRPDLTLAKVGQVLKPGGFLFLTTGDIGSILARLRREKWRLIHPPTHLHYFSRKTIARLLENSGLQPVQMKYVGVRRSLRQITYSLLVLGQRRVSRVYRMLAASPLGDLSVVLNTYDIMLVVGRKTPVT